MDDGWIIDNFAFGLELEKKEDEGKTEDKPDEKQKKQKHGD